MQVDVDFLRFKSCVLYTERENSDQPLINVEVVAHVTRPEFRSTEVSNRFYFTFTVRPEAKAKNTGQRIRKVFQQQRRKHAELLRMDADSWQSIMHVNIECNFTLELTVVLSFIIPTSLQTRSKIVKKVSNDHEDSERMSLFLG
ncbi:hypothetical protein Sango_0336600 [Sesamum angolense]|uniref:Uncharacterized protein n=1 Tax=Sesamum angolense TaxID=2727404 RepID=A0AAE2C3C4_9LAMI|nr:hypothetical protein Sango_0336600 [Sesamum angolense]